MDPTDLSNEELDYELMVRNVYTQLNENIRVKRKQLREMVTKENAGTVPIPSGDNSPYPPAGDLSKCEEIMRTIREGLNERPLDKQTARSLMSHGIHVQNRLLRIQT